MLIVCGLPDSLSAIESVAWRLPWAFGVKAIVTRQLLFAGRITPLHPFDEIAKSAALAPEMLAAIFVRDAFPLLERVAIDVLLPGID
jgi:hypothetical protein